MFNPLTLTKYTLKTTWDIRFKCRIFGLLGVLHQNMGPPLFSSYPSSIPYAPSLTHVQGLELHTYPPVNSHSWAQPSAGSASGGWIWGKGLHRSSNWALALPGPGNPVWFRSGDFWWAQPLGPKNSWPCEAQLEGQGRIFQSTGTTAGVRHPQANARTNATLESQEGREGIK